MSSTTVNQYGFFFDASRCNGCHACAVACKSWLMMPAGSQKPLKIHEWETGAFPKVDLHFLFVTCFHCGNPVCVDAAGGALYKEAKYGAVLLDPLKATSPLMRAAADACPYGAITFDSDATNAAAAKCNMCVDRLEGGLKPACVMVCHNRALDFDTVANLRTKYGTVTSIEGLPDGSLTNPSVVFKATLAAKKFVPYDESRALQLLNLRGSLPPTYSSPADVTTVPDGVVGRPKLVLKPNGTRDPQDTSVHDEG